MAQDNAEAPLMERPPSYRWMQLFMGIICMVMIANLQYGWTLFVNPITEKYGWSKAAIQVQRRNRLSVAVGPDPKLTVRARQPENPRTCRWVVQLDDSRKKVALAVD